MNSSYKYYPKEKVPTEKKFQTSFGFIGVFFCFSMSAVIFYFTIDYFLTVEEVNQPGVLILLFIAFVLLLRGIFLLRPAIKVGENNKDSVYLLKYGQKGKAFCNKVKDSLEAGGNIRRIVTFLVHGKTVTKDFVFNSKLERCYLSKENQIVITLTKGQEIPIRYDPYGGGSFVLDINSDRALEILKNNSVRTSITSTDKKKIEGVENFFIFIIVMFAWQFLSIISDFIFHASNFSLSLIDYMGIIFVIMVLVVFFLIFHTAIKSKKNYINSGLLGISKYFKKIKK